MSKVGAINGLPIGQVGALAESGGYLQISGSARLPLSRSSNLASAQTRDLFNNIGLYDTMQSDVGSISNGTSVAELIRTYPTLAELLAAMLNIRQTYLPLLAPTGAYLRFDAPGVYEYEVGTTHTMTIALTLDRGEWQPAPTTGGSIPYGVVTAGSMLNPFTQALIEFNIDAHERVLNVSTNITKTFFPSLQSWVINSVGIVTATGEPAYNADNLVTQMQQTLWSPSNSYTIRSYANIYLIDDPEELLNNAAADPTQANRASTERLTSNLNEAFVSQHLPNYQIWVPVREPQALYVYNFFFKEWAPQQLDDVWSKAQSTKLINGVSVTYWVLEFLNKGRGACDVRITF